MFRSLACRRGKVLIQSPAHGKKGRSARFSLDDSNWNHPLHQERQDVLSHVLPAQYSPNYLSFASYSFLASVSGSAAMVLSTQTLLVGVVGAEHSGILAGALNWILKDGVGQLGALLFASYMGPALDPHAKEWRIWGGILLDVANLTEMLAPQTNYLLPLACTASVVKNAAFLSIGASRAAIHQSFAEHHNLADVTAKAGSQNMVAGLLGTSIGIGVSYYLHLPTMFVGCSLLHQCFTYASLQHVVLTTLNRPRLALVVKAYLEEGEIWTPTEVAQKEQILWPTLDTTIRIGGPVEQVFSSPSVVKDYELSLHENRYLISNSPTGIDLMFAPDANGSDLIRGFVQATLLQTRCPITPNVDMFLEGLERAGWQIHATHLESSRALRLQLTNSI